VSYDLDEKDRRILGELVQDASQSVAALSTRLRIPRTTVQERIKRLRNSGIIRRFTVTLDHARLGKPATAFILVSFLPGAGISQKKLAHEIARIEDVVEVHIISGEWDILLKVRSESTQSIGSLVIDKLRAIEGVARTLTCVSFAGIKEET